MTAVSAADETALDGPLLSAAFLARLERLQLSTRRPLAGRFTGEHRSRRHGTSLDFADYREYTPGDDFRRIDYNLYARLDVLALKLFEAEDDLQVRFLLDTSGSMASGAKLRQAERVVAALGFLSLLRRDTVTIRTFPSEHAMPRFIGRSMAPVLFRLLEQIVADGPAELTPAARRLMSQPGLPGLTILVSDLLSADWPEAVRRLPSAGSDVVVVHVLSQEELDPTWVGDADLVDRETGARVPVSLSPDLLRAYRARVQRWLVEVATACRQAGAAYVRIAAEDSLEQQLLAGWREEGVVR